jgi:hypothetical protein
MTMTNIKQLFELSLFKSSKCIVDQGGYSQNFLSQILKIFVTLTWILEPIKHKL